MLEGPEEKTYGKYQFEGKGYTHEYGKKDFSITDNAESEIGDVLFSLICVSNALNIDMKKALDGVLDKYNNRFSKKGNIGSGR